MKWSTVNTIQTKVFSFSTSLLIFRILLGIVLFSKHGFEKIFTFSEMQKIFPDPIGIGATGGLIFALITDGICSTFIILGLFTRFAAALVFINMVVVFTLLHGFSFAEEHAELVFIYLSAVLGILFSGPGKYSADHILSKFSEK